MVSSGIPCLCSGSEVDGVPSSSETGVGVVSGRVLGSGAGMVFG